MRLPKTLLMDFFNFEPETICFRKFEKGSTSKYFPKAAVTSKYFPKAAVSSKYFPKAAVTSKYFPKAAVSSKYFPKAHYVKDLIQRKL